MRNAGLEEAQAGIKIAGRNINNLRYAHDTTLMAESEEELKSLLIKVKEESEKVGLKINSLRYSDDASLMAESKEDLKSPLMRVRGESENADLKVNIQKTKIMTSGPITSWQIDGEKVETVRDFIFLGSKITADGDCSHEIKRLLLLGRKAMTNLGSVLKRE